MTLLLCFGLPLLALLFWRLRPQPAGLLSPLATAPTAAQPASEIAHYYREATRDYALWSPGYHMHFGYARRWRDAFRLETMLQQQGAHTLAQLHLPTGSTPKLVDLGCGMGAVARQAAQRWPQAHITGLTLVPEQVRAAHALNVQQGLDQQINLLCEDFEHSNLPSQHFDGAYAVEAACYGTGPGKAALIREARRLLKPGARLVITDGFLQHSRPLPGWLAPLYRWLCACWAISEMAQLPQLLAELQRQGFTHIHVQDLRWRVAPSVLYVPWTTLKFFAQVLWRGELLQLSAWRWKNLVSPWLTCVLGLQRRHFGYYTITAQRG